MKTLYLDFETYSELDIKAVGSYKYLEHHSTRIVCVGYTWDEYSEATVSWNSGFNPFSDFIQCLKEADVLVAHNAEFDAEVVRRFLVPDIPKEKWRCTMVMSRIAGFPGKLSRAAEAVGLEHQKMGGIDRLMQKFCTPQVQQQLGFDEQEDIDLFSRYCWFDVLVCRDLYRALSGVVSVDWASWVTHWAINARGIPIDEGFCEAASELSACGHDYVADRLYRALGRKPVPASMKAFLEAKGYRPETGGIDDIRRAVPDEDAEIKGIVDLYEVHQEKSTLKYKVGLNMLCTDNRVRGSYMYEGTQTGRYSSYGLQIHNMKKSDATSVKAEALAIKTRFDALEPHSIRLMNSEAVSEQMKELGEGVRHMIRAPKGKRLLVSDMSSIEPRITLALTGDPRLHDVIVGGHDVYKVFAAAFFRVPEDQVSKDQRDFVKPLVLGFNYGGGIQAAAKVSKGISSDDAKAAVSAYRALYPVVAGAWKGLDNLLRYKVTTDTYEEAFLAPLKRPVTLCLKSWLGGKAALVVRLPSGREIVYREFRNSEQGFGYVYTSREGKVASLYGSKLFNNIVQGIAYDLLAYSLNELERLPGVDTVMHVHDEVVCEVHKDEVFEHALEVADIMCLNPSWATGIRRDASISVTKRYAKL
ncbi:DNA polymerase [Thiolapillus sp.]|uniref:DNA polymerase n=2 Tax=Thiolapillus sp. TaxID=2017437 RepID=UPI003AF9F5D1